MTAPGLPLAAGGPGEGVLLYGPATALAALAAHGRAALAVVVALAAEAEAVATEGGTALAAPDDGPGLVTRVAAAQGLAPSDVEAALEGLRSAWLVRRSAGLVWLRAADLSGSPPGGWGSAQEGEPGGGRWPAGADVSRLRGLAADSPSEALRRIDLALAGHTSRCGEAVRALGLRAGDGSPGTWLARAIASVLREGLTDEAGLLDLLASLGVPAPAGELAAGELAERVAAGLGALGTAPAPVGDPRQALCAHVARPPADWGPAGLTWVGRALGARLEAPAPAGRPVGPPPYPHPEVEVEVASEGVAGTGAAGVDSSGTGRGDPSGRTGPPDGPGAVWRRAAALLSAELGEPLAAPVASSETLARIWATRLFDAAAVAAALARVGG